VPTVVTARSAAMKLILTLILALASVARGAESDAAAPYTFPPDLRAVRCASRAVLETRRLRTCSR
jgi:hypothetical protein